MVTSIYTIMTKLILQVSDGGCLQDHRMLHSCIYKIRKNHSQFEYSTFCKFHDYRWSIN